MPSTDQSRGGDSPLIGETTSGGQLLVQQPPPSKIAVKMIVTYVHGFYVKLFEGCMDAEGGCKQGYEAFTKGDRNSD